MTTKAMIGVGVGVVAAGAAVAVSGSAGAGFGVMTKYAGEIIARLGATAVGRYIRQTIFHSSDDDDEEEEEEMEDDEDEEEEPQWDLSADSFFSMMTLPW